MRCLYKASPATFSARVATRISAIKVARDENALKTVFHHSVRALSVDAFDKFVVGTHKAESDFFLIIFGKPNAESRFKIVVARGLVVKSEALRTVSDKPDRNAIF